MVSLEERLSYLNSIAGTPKLAVFHEFIKDFSTPINFQEKETQNRDIFFELVDSVVKNDQQSFLNLYSTKSRSNPTKDFPAPFVNDDFLIFILIEGITKFDIDKKWIKRIIELRPRNPLTITFENILNENYYSKSNVGEIMLIHLHLNKQSAIIDEFLNSTYKGIIENINLFESRNDFQILCAIRAFDLILISKKAIEGNEIELLQQFNSRFIKRIAVLSWIIQAIIFLGIFTLVLKLPEYSPEAIAWIEKYGFIPTVLGVFGFTLLGNQIPFIKTKSTELIMRLLGYPKDLIKNNKILAPR